MNVGATVVVDSVTGTLLVFTVEFAFVQAVIVVVFINCFGIAVKRITVSAVGGSTNGETTKKKRKEIFFLSICCCFFFLC